jgi:hypothetical protein
MPHAFYPRAAVAVDRAFAPSPQPTLRPPQAGPRPKPQVLWAARPLQVRAGRLIGVRLRGNTLEVALVGAGADGPRWVEAATVLTAAQADVWAKTSRFVK